MSLKYAYHYIKTSLKQFNPKLNFITITKVTLGCVSFYIGIPVPGSWVYIIIWSLDNNLFPSVFVAHPNKLSFPLHLCVWFLWCSCHLTSETSCDMYFSTSQSALGSESAISHHHTIYPCRMWKKLSRNSNLAQTTCHIIIWLLFKVFYSQAPYHSGVCHFS